MHITRFSACLAILGALGSVVIGSPLEVRQLSEDNKKALGVIEDKKLGVFCDNLSGHNGSKRDLDTAAPLLARQNVNLNVNNNENGNNDNGENVSYSSSYSNGQEDIDYKIDGVTVPDDLKGYYPDAIEQACKDYKGKEKREFNAPSKTIHIQKRVIRTTQTTTEHITDPPQLQCPMYFPPRRTAPMSVQATVVTIFYHQDTPTPTAVQAGYTKLAAGRFKASSKGNLIDDIPPDFFGPGGAAGKIRMAREDSMV